MLYLEPESATERSKKGRIRWAQALQKRTGNVLRLAGPQIGGGVLPATWSHKSRCDSLSRMVALAHRCNGHVRARGPTTFAKSMSQLYD